MDEAELGPCAAAPGPGSAEALWGEQTTELLLHEVVVVPAASCASACQTGLAARLQSLCTAAAVSAERLGTAPLARGPPKAYRTAAAGRGDEQRHFSTIGIQVVSCQCHEA